MKLIILKGCTLLLALGALLSLGEGLYRLDLFFIVIGALLSIATWLVKAEYRQYKADPFQ